MTFTFFVQVFVNGLMLGLTYVLIASGFSLIYGIMRLLNFAHGEFYMLGAFATYLFCEHLGVNYFVAMALSMIIIAVRESWSTAIYSAPSGINTTPAWLLPWPWRCSSAAWPC